MACLDRSVHKFISEDGGGSGGYIPSDTIEKCYETMKLDNMEKPDIEFFTQKVNQYLPIFIIDDVRTKRNELLNESDWTQMNDVKLEDDVEWKSYRQALRDLPSVVDIQKVVYPLKPGEKVENK